MTPSRILEKGGDDYALARENVFTDQILGEMRAETLFVPSITGMIDGPHMIDIVPINYGKSHRFEWFGGDYTAEEHTPGDEMTGQQLEFDKGTITVDRIVKKSHLIALEDSYLTHYSPSQAIATLLGVGLAEDMDTKAAITAVSAARTAALTKNGITIHPGGNTVTRGHASYTSVDMAYPDNATGWGRIDDDVAQLAYEKQIDNVRPEFLVMTPWIQHISRHGLDIFNSDYSKDSNDLNSRVVGKWHGFTVLKPYNRMPNSLNLDLAPKYQVDCTVATGQPVVLALSGASVGKAAVGMVVAAGVSSYVEMQQTKNTVFHKAQSMYGFGVLHPQSAGLIQVRSS